MGKNGVKMGLFCVWGVWGVFGQDRGQEGKRQEIGDRRAGKGIDIEIKNLVKEGKNLVKWEMNLVNF